MQKFRIDVVDDARFVFPSNCEHPVDNPASGLTGGQIGRQIELRPQRISPGRRSTLAKKHGQRTFANLLGPDRPQNLSGFRRLRLVTPHWPEMTQTVEGLPRFAVGEKIGEIEAEYRLLRFVQQFDRLLSHGESRDPRQASDTKQPLQLSAHASLREFPLKSWNLLGRHWQYVAHIADPVMIALAQTQLPVGLVKEPVSEPNPPFEGVVKCRFGQGRLA